MTSPGRYGSMHYGNAPGLSQVRGGPPGIWGRVCLPLSLLMVGRLRRMWMDSATPRLNQSVSVWSTDTSSVGEKV